PPPATFQNTFLLLLPVLFLGILFSFGHFFITAEASTIGTITKPTNNLGLVGYWTFDGPDIDWDANTVADRSGTGNTGSLINMSTTTSPAEGKIGQALGFDGNDDYVSISDDASQRPQNTISLSTWVRFESLTSTVVGIAPEGLQYIIFKRNNNSSCFEGYVLSKSTGNNLLFEITKEGTGCTGAISSDAVSSTAVTTGRWYHVVGTFDGQTMKIYIDGVLEDTQEHAYDLTLSTQALRFGSTQQSYDGFLSGDLDETRIYNRALSASEISALYTSGQATLARTPVLVADGLVGHWTFDGPDVNWSANTVTDKSGTGNTGTLLNMSTTTSPVEGRIGQALEFDGVDDYASVPNSTSLNMSTTNAFTISLWVKMLEFPGSFKPLYYKNDAPGLWIDGTGGILLRPGGDVSQFIKYSSGVNKINTWYHLTATYDGTTEIIYVNGSLSGQQTAVGTAGSNSDILRIGGNVGGYFSKIMDDVRIYNRALSREEIQTIYNGTKPATFNQSNPFVADPGETLIGYWTFDGPKVNWANYTMSDSSKFGSTATIYGFSTTSSPLEGKTGQAFSFDGIDDYFTATLSESADSGTVSLWVRPESYTNNTNIWSYGNNSSSDNRMNYYVTKYGTIDFVRTASVNGEDSPVNIGFSRSLLPAGEWHNITATWNSSLNSIYLDGELQATSSGVTSAISSSQDAFVGTGDLAEYDSFRFDTVSSNWLKQASPYYLNGAVRMDAAANIYFLVPSTQQTQDWDLYFMFRSPTKDTAEGMEVRVWLDGLTGTYAVFDRAESANQYRVTWNSSVRTQETLSMTANVWYRGRVTKRGANVAFFVNDNQIGTTQSVGSDYNTTRIAFYNTPVSGGTVEYDDIRWVLVDGSGNILPSSTYFNGAIDEVRMYNTALTAEQVLQLYNFGR
ncbi:MAG: LamG domain-containing protein, partial [Candidatus Paceibacterota bacterium]